MTRLHPLAPVLALDIDGTLGDYYEHFRWFAELYLQRPVTLSWNMSDTAEFSEALGLSKEVYRQIKLAYRQGGMKRSLPAFDGTRHLIETVRQELGIQVWIATTRPWQRLDNIDPDTQAWVARIAGRVDGVIYGEEKYLDLIDIVGKDRIIGVVDDLPQNVVSAMSLGLRAALRYGGHNRAFRAVRLDTPVVRSSDEILQLVRTWIAGPEQITEEAAWLSEV